MRSPETYVVGFYLNENVRFYAVLYVFDHNTDWHVALKTYMYRITFTLSCSVDGRLTRIQTVSNNVILYGVVCYGSCVKNELTFSSGEHDSSNYFNAILKAVHVEACFHVYVNTIWDFEV